MRTRKRAPDPSLNTKADPPLRGSAFLVPVLLDLSGLPEPYLALVRR